MNMRSGWPLGQVTIRMTTMVFEIGKNASRKICIVPSLNLPYHSLVPSLKDGASFSYCAYVLRISGDSGFLRNLP